MVEEELLKQILAKLDNLESEMAGLKSTMATKEDLEAVKTDLATVKAEMATKEDLETLNISLRDNVLSLVADNLLPAMEAMEGRLTDRLDDLSQRLETVEVISGQNYTDIVKLRRAK